MDNLERHFTESELQTLGDALARGLHMKRDKAYPDRWQTVWGTKTGLGLVRMLNRFISEIKEGKNPLDSTLA